jgi:predicted acylesterase/phospholipase RssA
MRLPFHRRTPIWLSVTIAMAVAACAHVSKYELGTLEPQWGMTPEQKKEYSKELDAQAEDGRKPEWERGATPPEETPVVREKFAGMVTFSGGGYRALLFGLGAAWRLHELGTLCRVTDISSVSGGSILAAYIALRWKDLCPGGKHYGDFERIISEPIVNLARHTIDTPSVLSGLLVPGDSASHEVSRRLDKYLFHGARFRDLNIPRNPGMHIFATDLNTGLPWVFGEREMGLFLDHDLPSGEIRVADAVAASAAFPPVLSPARFSFPGADTYVDNNYKSEEKRRLARHYDRVLLGDGGLANNLGTIFCGKLAASLGPCFTIDAAVTPRREPVYPTWFGELLRSTDILYDRKEDEIRKGANAEDSVVVTDIEGRVFAIAGSVPGAENGSSVTGKVLIKLRNGGDLTNDIAEYTLLNNLDLRFSGLIQVARSGSPYLLRWAEDAEELWKAGYIEGDVRTLAENYRQYACDSMIPTRLKSLDDRTIHNLVNLGYLATDISIGARVALSFSPQPREGEISSPIALEGLIKTSVPGLLRVKLQLPMHPEPVPAKDCREALDW